MLTVLSALALLHVMGTGFPATAGETAVHRVDADSARYEIADLGTFVYSRPSPLGFIGDAARDVLECSKLPFRKENLTTVFGLAVATGALVAVDQQLVDAVQRGGDRVGIEPEEDNTAPFFSLFGYDLRFPTDVGSALYFIGDGWTHLTVGTTVLGYGWVADDMRALRTGTQVFEAVLAAGFVTQVLKHVTGRESPYRSTADGGKWRLFPDQIEYHRDIPAHDAFPSGHLATAMATVTVLAENYPEHTAIRPIGYGLMTLLGLQMMNNGVHWASDYPLALAIGYTIGKTAANTGRTRVDEGRRGASGSWAGRLRLAWASGPGGAPVAGITVSF